MLTRHTLRDETVCDQLLQKNLSELFESIATDGSTAAFEEKERHFIKLGSLLGYSLTKLRLQIAQQFIIRRDLLQARRTIRSEDVGPSDVSISLVCSFFCSLIDSNMLNDSERRLYVKGLVAIVTGIWKTLGEKGEDIEKMDIQWLESLSAEIVHKCDKGRYAAAVCVVCVCVWCVYV